jgi:hypothetical protein
MVGDGPHSGPYGYCEDPPALVGAVRTADRYGVTTFRQRSRLMNKLERCSQVAGPTFNQSGSLVS